jgi:cbb3-type cytochrome oxidase subunit 1
MPRLSIWMLRLSLVALLAGSFPGAWLLATEPAFHASSPALRLLHRELMLFGWLLQFVLGVAYWMFPRYPRVPERGSSRRAWAAFWLFEGGLALTLTGAAAGRPGFACSGRAVLAGATAGFLLLLWRRVRPFGPA